MQVLFPDMNGITITADDVLLDLGGMAIVGPKTGSGVGVQVLGANVTVNGGNISGFRYGAWAYNDGVYLSRIDASGNIAGGIRAVGNGVVVENSRVSGMIAAGEDVPHQIGISVDGENCHVRYNMITDAFSPPTPSVGMAVNGPGCQVYGNVSTLSEGAPPESMALQIGGQPPASISRNIFIPGAAF